MFAAACGSGGSGEPKPITGPAKDVATVIQRFEKATARHAGGDSCSDLLYQRARGVRHPRIRIRSIEIQGDQALVQVRTTATGQAPTSNVIRLVRENGSFRVLSLGR
jgi:hypothetical protein